MMPPNPLLGGKLWMSNDPGSIPYAQSMGYWVISIVDVSEAHLYPNTFTFSSLTPPYSAVAEIINGNLQGGIQKYMMYLAHPEREPTLASLLAVMNQRPINYLFFAEYDSDTEFHILETLASFFANRYGVIIGHFNDTINFPPPINLGDYPFLCMVADTLFRHQYLTLRDYARYFPHGPNIPVKYTLPTAEACGLILRGINYGFSSPEESMRACLARLESVRNEEQNGLINPMMALPQLSRDAIAEIRQRFIDQSNPQMEVNNYGKLQQAQCTTTGTEQDGSAEKETAHT